MAENSGRSDCDVDIVNSLVRMLTSWINHSPMFVKIMDSKQDA